MYIIYLVLSRKSEWKYQIYIYSSPDSNPIFLLFLPLNLFINLFYNLLSLVWRRLSVGAWWNCCAVTQFCLSAPTVRLIWFREARDLTLLLCFGVFRSDENKFYNIAFLSGYFQYIFSLPFIKLLGKIGLILLQR